MEHVRAAFGKLMGVCFSYGEMLDGKAATCRFHLRDEITDKNDNIASNFVELRLAKRACELFELAVEHGDGLAVDRVVAAYVKHMGHKRLELTGERLKSLWRGFSEAKAKQWSKV